MKKILTRFLVFLILYVLLIQCINLLIPYHWGNDGISTKISLSQEQAYENVFFGSSRTYRHIDPLLLDSLSSTANSFYNLGYQATFNPECFYLVENYMENNSGINIYVELQPIKSISNKNLNSEKSTYYQGLKYCLWTIGYFINSSYTSSRLKLIAIKNILLSFINNSFKLVGFKAFITSGLSGFNQNDFIIEHKSSHGFVSLNQSFKDDPEVRKRLIERMQELKNDPSLLEKRKNDAFRLNRIDKKKLKIDPFYLNKIESLIEFSEATDNHLIFILPPRLSEQNYKELLAVYYKIPSPNRINLSDPEQYAEHYAIEYSYDVGHLNEKGAKKYTTNLFNQILLLNK